MSNGNGCATGTRPTPPETGGTELADAASAESVVRILLRNLRAGSSPREAGLDSEHALTLCCASGSLPPILVHRPTMTVIDGHHRVVAAKLRGHNDIDVMFFDGTANEAFVEAVRLNVAHGKPLTLRERESAACRILVMFPDRSDRSIAQACGVSPKTVGNLRRRATEEIPHSHTRVGQDGRVRPVDTADARNVAAEMLRTQPNASLRKIARSAGTSVDTVRDVRARVVRGEDPLPRRRGRVVPINDPRPLSEQELKLAGDRACRANEDSSQFADWFERTAIRKDDWAPLVQSLPLNRMYAISSAALARAAAWEEVARVLDQHVRDRLRGSRRGSANEVDAEVSVP